MAVNGKKYQEENYKYVVEWSFINNGKERKLLPSQIEAIIKDNDYDNNNMPVMFVKCRIDKNMLDDMLIGVNKDFINMTMYKYDTKIKNPVKILYFKEQFIYFIDNNNPNYAKKVDYDITNDQDRTDIYRKVTLGLMKAKLINDNKRMCNGVFQNTNMLNVIHYFTNHMPMLLDPTFNNKKIDQIIIPPVKTVSKVIEYLDNYSVLYNTPYRFFIDFNATYLVSSKGNAIPMKTDKITDVIFNIHDIVENDAYKQAMITDYENNVYILDINSEFSSLINNTGLNKSMTKINGIYDDGDKNNEKVINDSHKAVTDKTNIYRLRNNNSDKTRNMNIDQSNRIHNIVIRKQNIDSSILTINKSYNVYNYSANSILNGKFLLSRKQEIFVFEENEFNTETVLYLRKIKS